MRPPQGPIGAVGGSARSEREDRERRDAREGWEGDRRRAAWWARMKIGAEEWGEQRSMTDA